MNLDARIQSVMARVLSLPPDDIGPETSFWSIESWDSISHVELIVALEKEFNVRLGAEEAASILDYQSTRETLARLNGGAERTDRDLDSTGVVVLADQLKEFPFPEGCVLLVHSSFRAIGPVKGGPLAVIKALQRVLLEVNGTLVMPTMTGRSQPDYRVDQTATYDMGLLPETFWRMEGVKRSTHPTSSFAAIGPLAEDLLRYHPLDRPEGPEGPLGRMYERDGRILLLGVDHTASTTIHLAEYLENVPYQTLQPVSRLSSSSLHRSMWCISHCARNFNQVGDILNALELIQHLRVGCAEAQYITMRDVVSRTRKLLARDPLAFLCSSAQCSSCQQARMAGQTVSGE